MNRSRALIVIADLLLRGFVLFGFLGLPVAANSLLGFWTPPSWMANPIATLLAVWLFTYGMGFLVIAAVCVMTAVVCAFVLADMFCSLLIGTLGFRPAITHFHETCETVGNLFTSVGSSLKSLDVSFPLDDGRK